MKNTAVTKSKTEVAKTPKIIGVMKKIEYRPIKGIEAQPTNKAKISNSGQQQQECRNQYSEGGWCGVDRGYAIGLDNMGSSCYLNTVMNMLRSIGGIKVKEKQED